MKKYKRKIIGILISGPFIFAIGAVLSLWLASEGHLWGIFIVIPFGIYWAIWKDDRDNKKAIKKMQQEKRKEQQEEKKVKLYYEEQLNKLVEKYGQPAKIINLEKYKLCNSIIVFMQSKSLYIIGKIVPIDNIISCSINQEEYTYGGSINLETKTSTGSIAKRAVVGTLIGGLTGAIIGGATAKKVTSGYSSDGGIGYNYTVFINVKDLSNPLIKIKLYSNADKANEITALINAVIEFNRR